MYKVIGMKADSVGRMWRYPSYFETFHDAVINAQHHTHAELWHAEMFGHFAGWKKLGTEPIGTYLEGEWFINPEEEDKEMVAQFVNGEYVGSFDVSELLGGTSGMGSSPDDAAADLLGDVSVRGKKMAANKKAAKAAPKKGATAKKAKATRNTLDMKAKIKVLRRPKDPKKGTRNGDSFALIKNGMSVQAFVDAYAKTKHAKEHSNATGMLGYFARGGLISIG